MAPWILIGIATLIGLLVRGLAGAVVGAIIGFVLRQNLQDSEEAEESLPR